MKRSIQKLGFIAFSAVIFIACAGETTPEEPAKEMQISTRTVTDSMVMVDSTTGKDTTIFTTTTVNDTTWVEVEKAAE